LSYRPPRTPPRRASELSRWLRPRGGAVEELSLGIERAGAAPGAAALSSPPRTPDLRALLCAAGGASLRALELRGCRLAAGDALLDAAAAAPGLIALALLDLGHPPTRSQLAALRDLPRLERLALSIAPVSFLDAAFALELPCDALAGLTSLALSSPGLAALPARGCRRCAASASRRRASPACRRSTAWPSPRSARPTGSQ
jgi:hypothetical protein